MTTNEQLFIRLRGRIQGPFAPAQLHALARRGQFSRSHEISTDGVSWSRAATRPELFPPPAVRAVPEMAVESEIYLDEPPPAVTTPPQAEVWYYHQLGKNQGPIDFSHLQYLATMGQIAPDDMVWKDGLPEWLPAGRVPGLFKPTTGGQAAQQPVPMYVATHPSTGDDFPRVSGLAIASLVLGLLWLFSIGSLLAIVFGSVALYQIRISRGRVAGTGLAIAGLVLGIVTLGLHVLYELDRIEGWHIFTL